MSAVRLRRSQRTRPTCPSPPAINSLPRCGSGIRRAPFACGTPRGTVSTLEKQATEGAETVLSLDTDILFAFDSAALPVSAGPAIAALLQPVPPAAAVSIIGHTDSLGEDAYNLGLSQRRAEAVAAAVALARPDLALSTEGRGEADPVAPNDNGGEDNADGRAANRRVEIRYAS